MERHNFHTWKLGEITAFYAGLINQTSLQKNKLLQGYFSRIFENSSNKYIKILKLENQNKNHDSNVWLFLDLKQTWNLFVNFVKVLSSRSCCSEEFYRMTVLNIFIKSQEKGIYVSESFFTTKGFMKDVLLRTFSKFSEKLFSITPLNTIFCKKKALVLQ